MPGAYAHITLVNIAKEPARLEREAKFPVSAITAILDYFKYCELGAVSPDYPYLAVGDSKAKAWADAMHYVNTGSMIHAGVQKLRTLGANQRRKPFAWLLGYAAHVTTDVTVHPVVNLKVGPYETNQRAHRICEMHQDAYIFQRLDLGDIGLAEHLDAGICACGEQGLDSDVRVVWEHMLSATHQTMYASSRPDIDKWHRGFKAVVDIAEEGNKLFPAARHVGVNLGLTYPAANQIDQQYIKNLAVPGGYMDYDDIFDRAVHNVLQVWGVLAAAVFSADEKYASAIGNWNLDTGQDPSGKFVLW